MRHSAVPVAVERAVAALPHDAHFMGIVLTALNALSTVHPEQNPALAGQSVYNSAEIQDKQIVRIIGAPRRRAARPLRGWRAPAAGARQRGSRSSARVPCQQGGTCGGRARRVPGLRRARRRGYSAVCSSALPSSPPRHAQVKWRVPRRAAAGHERCCGAGSGPCGAAAAGRLTFARPRAQARCPRSRRSRTTAPAAARPRSPTSGCRMQRTSCTCWTRARRPGAPPRT